MTRLPWIPWKWVRRNYPSAAPKPVSALFSAYNYVSGKLELESLAPDAHPGGDIPRCARCGTCCATLNPGLTYMDRYLAWQDSETLTGDFFKVVAMNGPRDRWFACWFFGDTRLRMCPLLFFSPDSGIYWCAVYHLGQGQRPEACESFRANPPHCEVSQRPLVP